MPVVPRVYTRLGRTPEVSALLMKTWKRELGAAVPIPTFPLPCCTTNCEEPMVNPWPVAMVEVPVVEVAVK